MVDPDRWRPMCINVEMCMICVLIPFWTPSIVSDKAKNDFNLFLLRKTCSQKHPFSCLCDFQLTPTSQDFFSYTYSYWQSIVPFPK